jgi:hypothetical protein
MGKHLGKRSFEESERDVRILFRWLIGRWIARLKQPVLGFDIRGVEVSGSTSTKFVQWVIC